MLISRKRALVPIAGLLCSFILVAQIDVGGVTGTVKDSTGAVIANANLTLTNEATGVAQRVQSSSSGTYVFEAVPVGSYTLKAEVSGFKAYVAARIEVHVQTVITADVALTVGATTETLTVTAAAPLIQAQDASLGQTIDSETMNDMPLNGRDWRALANLAAGSYLTGGPSGTSIFSNGAEPGQVDIRVNGVNNNEEVFGGVTALPPPDAVEEFKLQTGDNSAEFGHSTGAVINAVVKAGTNRLNGDVWEYLRNEVLNANDFFSNLNGTPRQEYRQNQFGGAIGGPVYLPKLYHGRNRTFFFFDYQRTQTLVPSTFTDNVPTNLMRSSNFTNLQDLITGNSGTETDALGRKYALGTVFDPATTRTIAAGAADPVTGLVNTKTGSVTVRDPFFTGDLHGLTDFTHLTPQLNIIPGSRIDPNAIKILQLLPAPTKGGIQNNFFTSQPAQTTRNTYDVRIDQNFSAKDLLFGAFSRATSYQTSSQPFQPLLGSALQTNFAGIAPTYLLTLSETHLFSPTLVNEARVGLNHNYNTRVVPESDVMGIPEQFGILGIPQLPSNGGLPTITLNGFSAFGSRRFSPTIQTTEAQEYTDNVTLIRGRHQFKTGFQFERTVGDIIQPSYSRGNLTYSGQYSDIANQNTNLVGVADFLLVPMPSLLSPSAGVTVSNNLGGVSGFNFSNFSGTNYTAPYLAAYAEDSWRITPTLTLKLGLRWDHFSPYSEDGGKQANFVQTDGNGPSGTYYIPQQGCNVPRSPDFNALLAADHIQVQCLSGGAVNQTQMTNFAPRLGVAWRIRPRFVARAGFGISYGGFDSVGYGGTMGTNYPFQYQINSPDTTALLSAGQFATIENVFASVNIQDPSKVQISGLSLVGKEYKYLIPYVESTNLTLQYVFTDKDSIQAGFIESDGRHLDTLGQHNLISQILPVGTNSNNYRPLLTLGTAQFLSSSANSNFRSMQATYEHRVRGGLLLLANYTWGKCMTDDIGKTGMGPGYRAQWLAGFGIHGDYTLCSIDATNLVHVSGQYALPFGKGKPLLGNAAGIANALVGGWRFNYIYTYQSGQTFTVGCPAATTTGSGCYALFVPGQNPYAGPHGRTQWLNPDAFAQPPVATQIGQTDYSPLGGMGNQLRGPSLQNLDASLLKRFSVRERKELEFRAEAFNISNSVSFSTTPSQLNFRNKTGFSQLTSARNNQRLVQLALKLFF